MPKKKAGTGIGSYRELANAIILQAAIDYKGCVAYLKRHPRSADKKRMKRECIRFFLSEWFVALTDIDGKVLLKKFDKEAAENDSQGILSPD